ncbi:hypothetical protein APHAL10511_008006 [Amanita phalloides]|nr:hypothetical protein APHAL10511_008006 [Amanita phalloides]
MATLEEFIASQEDLVKEAALALPHEFSKCTYNLGYIRQAVYLCLSCPEQRGICAACSIACHTDHEQLELFPKRHFRCDCPTTSVAHACALHSKLEDENIENAYGQNFKGVFCRCSRPYDAKTERETMFQCLMCEDWFHESCCNLRERPSSREPTPQPTDESEQIDDGVSDASSDLPPALITAADYESFVCGACASKSELLRKWAGTPGILMVVRDSPEKPWRRLKADQVALTNKDVADVSESLGLGIQRPYLRGAGGPHSKTPHVHSISIDACIAPSPNGQADQDVVYISKSSGTKQPLPHGVDGPQSKRPCDMTDTSNSLEIGTKPQGTDRAQSKISPISVDACLTASPNICVDQDNEDVTSTSKSSEMGKKRSLPDVTDVPQSKRPRVPSIFANRCLVPPPNAISQTIFTDLSAAKTLSLGTGDLFLTEGFRDRWCHCEPCTMLLSVYPYLLEEEETHELPQDPDSGLSLEELGLRALSRVPRDRAIDGIHAFNAMRDELVNYLRPFAQEGRVVSESDVRSFFASLKEGRNPK